MQHSVFDPGFQDESLQRLSAYAKAPLDISAFPEHLDQQISDMQKYLGSALLGIMRFNPELSSIYFQDEKRGITQRRPYESMPEVWNDNEVKGQIRPIIESMSKPVISFNALEVSFTNVSRDEKEGGVRSIGLLLSSQQEYMTRKGITRKPPVAQALATDSSYLIAYNVSPLTSLYEDETFSDVPMAALTQLNPGAVKIFERYGEVGLYQQSLHTAVREILSGIPKAL